MARQISKHAEIQQDLHEIFDFIAQDSPKSAQRVLHAITFAIEEIEAFPELAPPYLPKSFEDGDLRRKTVAAFPRYSIFYKFTDNELRFLYVLSGQEFEEWHRSERRK